MNKTLFFIITLIASVFSVNAETYSILLTNNKDSFTFDCHKDTDGKYKIYINCPYFHIDDSFQYVSKDDDGDSFSFCYAYDIHVTAVEISYDRSKQMFTYTKMGGFLDWLLGNEDDCYIVTNIDITEWNKIAAYLKRCENLIDSSHKSISTTSSNSGSKTYGNTTQSSNTTGSKTSSGSAVQPDTNSSDVAKANSAESFTSKIFTGKVQKNVVRDGEKGLLIQTAFNTTGPRKSPIYLIASFADRNYKAIETNVSKYARADGKAWTWGNITLPYTDNHFDNCELFIPYAAFHKLPKGVNKINFYITIQGNDGIKEITSEYIPLYVNLP